jgi:uncharacterized membrane protein YadS
VVLFFAVRHRAAENAAGRRSATATAGFSITRFVPWFIIGFLLFAALRSFGVIPAVAANPTRLVSGWLTIASLAALGLGVDLKAITKVSSPVILTVSGSLLGLMVLAVGLIHTLGIQ